MTGNLRQIIWISALACTLSLVGCFGDRTIYTGGYSKRNFDQIRDGDPIDKVYQLIGRPFESVSVRPNDAAALHLNYPSESQVLECLNRLAGYSQAVLVYSKGKRATSNYERVKVVIDREGKVIETVREKYYD